MARDYFIPGHSEGRHNPVAYADAGYGRPCLNYLARKFMAHDEAIGRRLMASEHMQFPGENEVNDCGGAARGAM